MRIQLYLAKVTFLDSSRGLGGNEIPGLKRGGLRVIMKDSVTSMERPRNKVDIWKTGRCLMFLGEKLLTRNQKGE